MRPIFRVPLRSVLFLCCLAGASLSAAAPDANVQVRVEQGVLVGRRTGTGREFLGIPYAAPPVGALRWRPPQPAEPWNGARQAQSFGAVCPQLSNFGQPPSAPIGTEDCLSLNVYAPSTPQTNLPVAVWIHGGGYQIGTGAQDDGSVFAERNNLVVVTINYRLGALGFLATPELSRETPDGGSGNFGLLDQQMALRWVQRNIAAFGGDPTRVTIFGESAGGHSVCEQLVSPAAWGLFHRAIIQSGVCGAPGSDTPVAKAEQSAAAFAKSLGCAAGDLPCLRAVPASKIVATPSSREGLMGSGSWGPVSGDRVVPRPAIEAIRDGDFARVPVINGSNRDEGNLFALLKVRSGQSYGREDYVLDLRRMYGPTKAADVLVEYPLRSFPSPLAAFSKVLTDSEFACPALRLDRLLALRTATYAYEFSDPKAISVLPRAAALPSLGAYHAGEIAYIFQARSQLANPAAFTADQRILADHMSAEWASFMRDGTPNALVAERWPRFEIGSELIREFVPGKGGFVRDFSSEHRCDFWEKF